MKWPLSHRGSSIVKEVSALGVLLSTLIGTAFPGSSQTVTLLRQIADLNPGLNGSFPSNLTAFGSTLCFSAYTTLMGRELWTYDGRVVSLASNINDTVTDIGFGVFVGNDSVPDHFKVFGGALYFSAFDPRRGGELWRWDGTNAARVADINPDANDVIKPDPLSSWPSQLTVFHNLLCFSANNDGVTTNFEPWRFDGSSTLMLTNIHPDLGNDFSSYPRGLTAFGDSLYFMADDGAHGYELWKASGTNGAVLFDINPGGANSSSYPKYFTALGDKLYFQALNDSYGFELWQTDGTNVSLVSDLNPGKADSNPDHLTVFNGALYFSANDGINGYQLWKYIPEGVPTLVTNINLRKDSYPKNLTVFKDQLCFAADDGVHGWELWASDGNSAWMVTDLNTNGDSFPEALTVFNGALYFVATTLETGYELWKYDGTNVTIAADINPGPGSSYPQNLAVFNNELCFSAAADGLSNWELWSLSVSNVIPAAVTLLSPGFYGDQFSFSFLTQPGATYDVEMADDPVHGPWNSIWTVLGTGAPVRYTNTILPNTNAFYRVQSQVK